MKKFFKKFFKNKSKIKDEAYKTIILPKIIEFSRVVKTKETISFMHYGHLGDIINSLPIIKELSKTKICNLYIQKNKKIPDHVVSKEHPFGSVYLTENAILKMLPLLKNQKFINKVEIYDDQKIDIDLNFFRELPINFNIDSVRWYFHLTGIHTDLSKRYIDVDTHKQIKDRVVIMRSLRRQNNLISYKFLGKYENPLFVGLKEEYNDLKKTIKNLDHYECKDFLELASIIKTAKIFIGNLSFGYAIAEAVKVKRLLESAATFPLVYPNGENAYDFYFQNHFENLFKKLYYN